MALCFRLDKKLLVLIGISHDDFDTNVMFFQFVQSFFFPVRPFLLTSISPFVKNNKSKKCAEPFVFFALTQNNC